MVAMALSAIVMAGVLSAFLFIGQSGFRSSSYSELEAQVRRGLDTFSADARMANNIQWNSDQNITFFLPTSGNGSNAVTYAYDPSTTGSTPHCFYRMAGVVGSGGTRRILVRDVDSSFSFSRFKLEQTGITDNSAFNDLETKLIQVNLKVAKTASTVGSVSQTGRSARYLLRNKRVTN